MNDSTAAYVIVYACDDKTSFDRAVDTLYNLRQKQHRDDVIFFVGNKSDLVRSRCVTADGECLRFLRKIQAHYGLNVNTVVIRLPYNNASHRVTSWLHVTYTYIHTNIYSQIPLDTLQLNLDKCR